MLKINKIKNVNRFLEVVDQCNGSVYLLTEQGDRLNLKSKLTQFVALANILGVESEFSDLMIQADMDDLITLTEYLVRE